MLPSPSSWLSRITSRPNPYLGQRPSLPEGLEEDALAIFPQGNGRHGQGWAAPFQLEVILIDSPCLRRFAGASTSGN